MKCSVCKSTNIEAVNASLCFCPVCNKFTETEPEKKDIEEWKDALCTLRLLADAKPEDEKVRTLLLNQLNALGLFYARQNEFNKAIAYVQEATEHGKKACKDFAQDDSFPLILMSIFFLYTGLYEHLEKFDELAVLYEDMIAHFLSLQSETESGLIYNIVQNLETSANCLKLKHCENKFANVYSILYNYYVSKREEYPDSFEIADGYFFVLERSASMLINQDKTEEALTFCSSALHEAESVLQNNGNLKEEEKNKIRYHIAKLTSNMAYCLNKLNDSKAREYSEIALQYYESSKETFNENVRFWADYTSAMMYRISIALKTDSQDEINLLHIQMKDFLFNICPQFESSIFLKYKIIICCEIASIAQKEGDTDKAMAEYRDFVRLHKQVMEIYDNPLPDIKFCYNKLRKAAMLFKEQKKDSEQVECLILAYTCIKPDIRENPCHEKGLSIGTELAAEIINILCLTDMQKALQNAEDFLSFYRDMHEQNPDSEQNQYYYAKLMYALYKLPIRNEQNLQLQVTPIISILEDLLAKNPQNMKAVNLLGVIFFDEGRLDKNSPFRQKAVALAEKYPDFSVRYLIAELFTDE